MRDMYFFLKKYWILCFLCGLLVLFALAPIYDTGVIINDELQGRFWAMQGLANFVKNDFTHAIRQGRVFNFLIECPSHYMDFLGVGLGTVFKITRIFVLLANVIILGFLVQKLFSNKGITISVFLIEIAFMPITFEHVAPNAYICLFGIPFIFVLLSLIFFIEYIENGQRKSLVLSMILFFLASAGYEMFVTYLILFITIAIGKTSLPFSKKNSVVKKSSLYVFPALTAFAYILSYFTVRVFFAPGVYEGNKLSFVSIGSSVKVLADLFVASIPGRYVFNAKYQWLKANYQGMHQTDYIRIVSTTLIFLLICLLSIKLYSRVSRVRSYNRSEILKDMYIVLCGIAYMIIPTIPYALSKRYQNDAIGGDGFLAVPASFFTYLAGAFVVAYLAFGILRYMGEKPYIAFAIVLAILVFNIQQMNDIFAAEQHDNFDRILEIEDFLDTNSAQSCEGIYDSEDLYKWQNALAIHDGYWTQYCANLLHRNLDIVRLGDNTDGHIFYEDDSFVIVEANTVHLLSKRPLEGTVVVKVGPNEYIPLTIFGNTMDKKFYLYESVYKESDICRARWSPLEGFSDGWLLKESRYLITTGDEGKITFEVYYPYEDVDGKEMKFSIGDTETVFPLSEVLSGVEIYATPNSHEELSISCNYEFRPDNGDSRLLSALLIRFNVE